MQVAHDGQLVKRENKNRQFSLYFHRFEKGVFTQKSSENTIRFSLLTGWPLGERKKWKTTCGKHKKGHFLKIAKNNSKTWYLL